MISTWISKLLCVKYDIHLITNISDRFKKATVKECIHQVVQEYMSGKVYDAEAVGTWSQDISNQVKTRLKGKINIHEFNTWILWEDTPLLIWKV